MSYIWGILFSILVSYWAYKRGYAWWAYFLTSPIIGAIALGILPNLNEPGKEFENREELVQKGNTTGLIISGITVAFFVYIGSLK